MLGDGAASDRSPGRLAFGYLQTLERSADLITGHRRAVREGGCTSRACSSAPPGKDRTGVLSAVVLGAIGVKDEDIVEDYFLTAESIEADHRTVRSIARLPGHVPQPPAVALRAVRGDDGDGRRAA